VLAFLRSPRAWILAPLAVFLFANALAYANRIPRGWFHSPWDKAMHFSVYGAIAFCMLPWLPNRWSRWALWVPLMLAVADEGIQSFSRNRSADFYDLAADAAGALLAYVAARRLV